MVLTPQERKEQRKLEDIIRVQTRFINKCEDIISRYRELSEQKGFKLSWAIEEIEHELHITQTKNAVRVEELREIRTGVLHNQGRLLPLPHKR